MKFLIIFATIVVLVLCQFDDDIPPFLKGAPQSTIKEFETILQNGQSQTDQQLDANINAWIAKQTSAIQNAYRTFMAQIRTAQQQAEQARRTMLAKFSADARAADAQLTKIAEDPRLTGEQKQAKIEATFKGSKLSNYNSRKCL
ncbi:unnamed protein product [Dracunculus medinensis]|uniref:DUF148 domain-containing protein n=1 Tax=Dracunculus medinensis TaxID=318479 RepID=A0A0N4U341_DRAME|nr:unnamed protein product [Dracunculus medinensis]